MTDKQIVEQMAKFLEWAERRYLRIESGDGKGKWFKRGTGSWRPVERTTEDLVKMYLNKLTTPQAG